MNKVKGKLMSKDAFLTDSAYAKEPYEGIMVSMNTENSKYLIGVQLSENKVLLVDEVCDQDVKNRLLDWIPRVNEIQRQYEVKNDLANYCNKKDNFFEN
jgi:hypoxanthine phosphoribosyltransferase